jgi:hypothetical protein
MDETTAREFVEWITGINQMQVEWLGDVMQRCAALQAAATLVAASSEYKDLPLAVQANQVDRLMGDFQVRGILDPA